MTALKQKLLKYCHKFTGEIALDRAIQIAEVQLQNNLKRISTVRVSCSWMQANKFQEQYTLNHVNSVVDSRHWPYRSSSPATLTSVSTSQIRRILSAVHRTADVVRPVAARRSANA